MKQLIKKYDIFSKVTVLLWGLIGVSTILSVVNGLNHYLVNGIMGSLFIAIAYFFYKKSKVSINLWNNLDNNSNSKPLYTQFLNLEFILMGIGFLFGLIFISAIISRVFIEKFPVFG